MRVTRYMLQQLGACGAYLDRFDQAFPRTDERYVDGVEVTPEVCEENYQTFDWGWAAENMLTYDAQRAWVRKHDRRSERFKAIAADETANQEERDRISEAWKTEFNQDATYPTWDTNREARAAYEERMRPFDDRVTELGQQREKLRASTFGEMMMTPANYSTRLLEAERLNVREQERLERQDLTDAEQAVANARSNQDEAERQVEDYKRRATNAKRRAKEWGERVPVLEQALVAAQKRHAERQLGRLQRQVEEATARLEAAKALIADAQSEEKTDESADATAPATA